MEVNQYLDVFLDESREHLQNMNTFLLKLENQADDSNLVNEIFRAAHTLKGMSATMGYEDMAHLTHQLENVLDLIRNGKMNTNSNIIDTLFEATDHLEAMIQGIANGEDGKKDVSGTIRKLEIIESGEANTASESEDSNHTPVSSLTAFNDFEATVISQSMAQGFNAFEVNISLREDCILKAARVFMVFEVLEQVGEIVKSIPRVEQLEEEAFDHSFSVTLITKVDHGEIKQRILKVSEINDVVLKTVSLNHQKSTVQSIEDSDTVDTSLVSNEQQNKPKDKGNTANIKQNATSKTIRVNINRLDQLMNLFEELVIDRGRLEEISRDLKSNDLIETVERMTRVSSDLQNIILNLRMVPIDQVFNRFPRMVRGLSKELNKQVRLDIIGADTELDRTVIDEIGDPLVHIIRNSMDHGVETPVNRVKAGKSEEGLISLKAFHSGNHVFIEISDDGAGINKDIILSKAINKALIDDDEAEQLSDRGIYQLMFLPGFSTAETISDISGRGVGLDVVKNKIESLGGSVTVDSEIGKGTTFTIELPLTLSIISVMLVEVKSEKYAISLTSILETAIVKRDSIRTAHHQPVIYFRDSVVPIIDISRVLDVPGSDDEKDFISLVIVKKGEKMAALIVDSFIGQQEIVIKSLGSFLGDIFAISGATILGDGQVALILDSNALIK